MRVAFEGWARNCGRKIMLDKAIDREKLVTKIYPLARGELKLKRYKASKSGPASVRLFFDTEMRLGGHQMGVVEFTAEELLVMLEACITEEQDEQSVSII